MPQRGQGVQPWHRFHWFVRAARSMTRRIRPRRASSVMPMSAVSTRARTSSESTIRANSCAVGVGTEIFTGFFSRGSGADYSVADF